MPDEDKEKRKQSAWKENNEDKGKRTKKEIKRKTERA